MASPFWIVYDAYACNSVASAEVKAYFRCDVDPAYEATTPALAFVWTVGPNELARATAPSAFGVIKVGVANTHREAMRAAARELTRRARTQVA